MKVLIRPKKLSGKIDVIPSKSYSHRAIIAASLAAGKSTIKNIIFSEDIKRTIEACEALGAKITRFSNYLEIIGSPRVQRKNNVINAGESGSTIRFMIPIMLTLADKITFTGENNLVNRPLAAYFEIFDQQGIAYQKGNTWLPFTASGRLKPQVYQIKGDVSSQFITGLLFALPLLEGDSKIEIIGRLESKGYIDLTLDILNKFQIKIVNDNYQNFYIPGNQFYQPFDYTVEGDYSQAAFFLAMGALGNKVSLCCMEENSLQGDRKIINDLKQFGCSITFQDDVLTAETASLIGTTIDLSQSPDLGPILSVVASLATGKSHFVNAGRLRIKECDRISAMREELNKLGAKVSETETEMFFEGVSSLKADVELNCHNDHRVAMSLAVAATIASKPVLINGAECVKKSYPNFWDDYRKLGGDFDVID